MGRQQGLGRYFESKAVGDLLHQGDFQGERAGNQLSKLLDALREGDPAGPGHVLPAPNKHSTMPEGVTSDTLGVSLSFSLPLPPTPVLIPSLVSAMHADSVS